MKGCIRESIWDCRTKEHADSIHVQRRHLIPAGSQRRHQLISGFAIDLHRLRGWYGSRGIGSWTSALAWLWKINKTNIVWETHDALKLKGNPMNAIDFETTVAGHYTSLRREGKNCVQKERADFATGVASFVLAALSDHWIHWCHAAPPSCESPSLGGAMSSNHAQSSKDPVGPQTPEPPWKRSRCHPPTPTERIPTSSASLGTLLPLSEQLQTATKLWELPVLRLLLLTCTLDLMEVSDGSRPAMDGHRRLRCAKNPWEKSWHAHPPPLRSAADQGEHMQQHNLAVHKGWQVQAS